jgi:hypothetical protein
MHEKRQIDAAQSGASRRRCGAILDVTRWRIKSTIEQEKERVEYRVDDV